MDARKMTDAEAAAARVNVGKYFYYHSPEKKKAARDYLRSATEYESFRKQDGPADCIIEFLWNILVGNYDE